MLYVIAIAISAAAGFIAGIIFIKKSGEAKLSHADEISRKIIEEAQRDAERKIRESEIEIKDKKLEAKLKFEREAEAKRREAERLFRRIKEREKNIERKGELMTRKERETAAREKEVILKEKSIVAKDERLTRLLDEENAKLQRIGRMTTEEARHQLLANLESQVRHESAQMIKDIRDRAKETAEHEAKEVITMAIQRCATDHVVETTVTTVALPNDEIKGRIIGREGRNIRAFENSTGVEVTVDDTPEAVTVSAFDPVRREVAKIALEKLISNGRIHPVRIEEVVKKASEEVKEDVKKAGEDMVLEVGIAGLNPELIKYIGRLKYRRSYGQNVLQHSKEVAYLAELIASQLDLDANLAKRAGLLHDIGKATDQSHEGTHAKISADLCERYGESDIIVNAVAAHHEEAEPKSLIAVILQAADAISGSRPGARTETLEAYIERVEKLESVAASFTGVEKAYAIQAGREVRIMVEPKKISDLEAEHLAREIANRIEAELKYPGQIRVTVIREVKAIEYAK